MTRKGKFPLLLARVTCLQQVINCIAYVAGVERDEGQKRRDKGERIFPFPYRAFLPLPSPPPFLCACHAGYQLQWMLLEMSLPLLSRLRAVSLLLKNLWGSGISEYRDQRVVRVPVPASWRQHNTGALLLEYSNIPLPHRFSNKISLEQKRDCSQSFCYPSPNKSTVLYQNIPF